MILLVRQGTAFVPRYVSLLTEQIRALHPDEPVVTLTDQADTPGVARALFSGLLGWWAKLELFAPWNADLRPALFLDLDTYVLGDIGELLKPCDTFGMLSDLYYPERPASGVMVLPEDCDAIWRQFQSDPDAYMYEAGPYGDGAFLGPFCEWRIQGRFPEIYSYKASCREAPKGSVVCFHGFPKPHEADGWAGDVWNG